MKSKYIVIILLTFSIVLAQPSWHRIDGPYGGRIGAVAINEYGFAAAAGAGSPYVYYSTDSGSNWVRCESALPSNISGLRVWVNGDSNIYAGHYYSSDRGQTWSEWNYAILDVTPDGKVYGLDDYGGLVESLDNGHSWDQLGVGNGLSSIAITSNGRIYVGSIYLGVRWTSDGGFNWFEANNGLESIDINAIAVDTNDSLYCASKNNGEVYMSGDGGENWHKIYDAPYSERVKDLDVIDTTTIMIVISDNSENLSKVVEIDTRNETSTTIWSSSATRQDDIPTSGINHLSALSIEGNAIIVATGAGVLKSVDKGVTWSYCNSGIINHRIQYITHDPNDALYVSTIFPSFLYKRDQYSDQWIDISPVNVIPQWNGGYFALAFLNGSTAYYAAFDTLLRSEDGGFTWTGLPFTFVRDVKQDVNGNILIGTGDGIYKSSDNGAMWDHILQTAHRIEKITVANDSILFAYGESRLYRSVDAGYVWTPVSMNVPCQLINYHDGILYAASHNGFYRSDDYGSTWELVNSFDNMLHGIEAFLMTHSNGNMYLGTYDGVYLSLDKGISLFAITRGFPESNDPNYAFPYVGVSALGESLEGYVFAGTQREGILFIIDDYEAPSPPTNLTVQEGDGAVTLTWEKISALDFGNYRIYSGTTPNPVIPSDSLSVIDDTSTTISGLINGQEYYFRVTAVDTLGNESSFSNEVSPTPSDQTAPATPQNLVAGAGDGQVILIWAKNTVSDFLRYRIYGDTTANPATAIDSTESSLDTTITVSGLDNGVAYYFRITAVDTAFNESDFSNEVSAMPTALAVEKSSGVPTSFALHQAYPNPFNPTTTIRFDLPHSVDISIVVYDLLGREVVPLVDGDMTAGYHQVIWDGRTASGREVPTGIYIARLITPQYTKSIKMVLLK